MIKYILFYLSLMPPYLFCDDHSHELGPGLSASSSVSFALAFGQRSPEVDRYIALLNEGLDKEIARKDVSLKISPNGRIGGGTIGISGYIFDLQRKIVIEIGWKAAIIGPEAILNNLPYGRYRLEIKAPGIKWTQPLLVDRASDNSIGIAIPEQRIIEGIVEGVPSFAIDSPVVNVGTDYAVVDRDGKFKIKTTATEAELVKVICRMANQDLSYKQPIYRIEWSFPRRNDGRYKLADFSGNGTIATNILLEKKLVESEFDQIRQRLGVLVRRNFENGDAITFRLNPDENGRASVANIAAGSYDISIDETIAYPWLIADHQSVTVEGGATEATLTARLPVVEK